MQQHVLLAQLSWQAQTWHLLSRAAGCGLLAVAALPDAFVVQFERTWRVLLFVLGSARLLGCSEERK